MKLVLYICFTMQSGYVDCQAHHIRQVFPTEEACRNAVPSYVGAIRRLAWRKAQARADFKFAKCYQVARFYKRER